MQKATFTLHLSPYDGSIAGPIVIYTFLYRFQQAPHKIFAFLCLFIYFLRTFLFTK